MLAGSSDVREGDKWWWWAANWSVESRCQQQPAPFFAADRISRRRQQQAKVLVLIINVTHTHSIHTKRRGYKNSGKKKNYNLKWFAQSENMSVEPSRKERGKERESGKKYKKKFIMCKRKTSKAIFHPYASCAYYYFQFLLSHFVIIELFWMMTLWFYVPAKEQKQQQPNENRKENMKHEQWQMG